ncbi:UNVERIFIED_CONTAM: hypothetical protein ABID98_003156 [Brevibacillus sp. OAP136]
MQKLSNSFSGALKNFLILDSKWYCGIAIT